LNFLNKYSKNNQISGFLKIHPVGAEVFRADRQADRQTDRETISKFYEITDHTYVHETIPSVWVADVSFRVD